MKGQTGRWSRAIFGFASVAVFLSSPTVLYWSSARAQNDNADTLPSVYLAAADAGGRRFFVLDGKGALSILDAETGNTLLSDVHITGVERPIALGVSPSGEWIAIVSAELRQPYPSRVLVVRAEDVINRKEGAETRQAPIGIVRDLALEFSPDEKYLAIANTSQNTVYILRPGLTDPPRVVEVGKGPGALAFDAGTTLFVANRASNDVSVIALDGGGEVSTITVGTQPGDILFAPSESKVFVSNTADGTVSVISAKNRKVLATVNVGSLPVSLAYDTKRQTVFVANNGDGTIHALLPSGKTRVLPIRSPAYHRTGGMQLLYATAVDRLFILNPSEAKFIAIDGKNDAVVAELRTDAWPLEMIGASASPRIFIRHFQAAPWVMDAATLEHRVMPLPGTGTRNRYFSSPQSVEVDEETNTIYVSNLGNNTVTVVDGNSHRAIKVVPVASSPQVLRLNTATKKIYISHPTENIISVLDARNIDAPQKTIPVGRMPRSFTINEANGKIYVTNSGDGTVSVIDGNSDTLRSTIALGSAGKFPLVVSVDERRNRVFVANYGGDTISVIDGESDRLLRSISVGKKPIWIRFLTDSDRMFVSVEGDKKLVRINPETLEVAETFDLARSPYRIFYDAVGKLIYVNYRDAEMVTVLQPAATQGGKSTILTETPIPYYGQTDTVYNMLRVNEKTGLAYVTRGGSNDLLALKLERAGANQILAPVWFAKIREDGTPIFNEQLQTGSFWASKSFLTTLILALLALIFIGYFIRRHRPAPAV